MNPSERIQNRYQLCDRIGTGGQANVYKAYDEKLERTVALKILAEHLTHEEHFIERFRHEARAAAGLQHPHIIQVFDFNQDPDSARYFIVMEYLKGPSLADKICTHGRIPAAQMVAYLIEAARGLDYAHERGVIHRDIKPANLQLTRPGGEGRIKLVDFGIAKIAEQPHLTQVGSLLGTAAYFAPEQLAGQRASAQSDIYALGICAYQGLHGLVPHKADNIAHLVLLRQEMPPALDKLHNDIPSELARIVDWCLAPQQEDRPRSAKELVATLNEVSVEQINTLEPYSGLVDRSQTVLTPNGDLLPFKAATHKPARNNRQKVIMGVVLGMLLLASLGIVILAGKDERPQSPIAPVKARSLDRQVPAFKQFILEHTEARPSQE